MTTPVTQPTSVLSKVRAYLKDAMRTALPDAVQVEYARPTDLETEAVWFGPSSFTQDYGPMQAGRKQRNETGSVGVSISAAVEGQTAQEADDRVMELWAVLENVIADDPTLGMLVLQAGIDNGTNQTVPDTEGECGYIHLTVMYAARLS